MTIEAQLNDALKDAMRSRDQNRMACIRQVKAKVQETVNAQDFHGQVDDALYQAVIASYIKSLAKGLEELEAAGPRGEALRDKYRNEIAYLERFLPALMTEDETRALVRQALSDTGVTDVKQVGKVIGAVMKAHKGEVDAGLVRELAEQALAVPSSE